MPEKIFIGKTDTGLRRQNNEDIFLVSPEFDFCLAADGMGGAAAGEVASEIFAQTTLDIFSINPNRSEKDTLYRVQKAYLAANEKILEHVSAHPDHKGMGCTAELLAFSEQNFFLGHIGDSRTYRLRDGLLEQLTEDHTLVQQQFQEGLISQDEIRNHPMRHVIFRAVGIKEEMTIDLLKGKTHPDDLFLLCSDGLSDMLDDQQIHEILCTDTDIEHKTENLIESAKAAGGLDNITVVLVAIA
ncbi:MAG: Stp1/IreP family PP2C-type Ser/Thr phosphatase [Deltaproteobacteria bacterium]|nr:Stp1/IreP family PP2C-type Ser/Thr phosphatase [Deltaproteobacteria bacterium]